MNNLTEIEIHALNEALNDEHHAWATYDQVIADFGEVRPFSNIREAGVSTQSRNVPFSPKLKCPY